MTPGRSGCAILWNTNRKEAQILPVLKRGMPAEPGPLKHLIPTPAPAPKPS